MINWTEAEFCAVKKKMLDTRTRLYSIEPMGLGTPFVESLISYIVRLSEVHNLTVASFISYVCAPLNEKTTYIYSYHSSKVSSSFYKVAQTMLGRSELGEAFRSIISQLTQRDDIHSLTISNWGFISPGKMIINKSKHWCGKCYSEWQANGKPIYDPLIWSLNEIKICSIHKTKLLKACPHCNKGIPVLNGKSMTARCIYCYKSLCQEGINDELSLDEISFHTWVSTSIEELLLEGGDTIDSLSISIAIKNYRDVYCNGLTNILINKLHLSDRARQVYSYCNQKSAPSLNMILWYCYVLKASFKELCIMGEFISANSSYEIRMDFQKLLLSESRYLFLNQLEIKTLLDRYIERDEVIPFKRIARDLNVDASYLAKRFPVEAKKISEKYLRFRSEQSKASLEAKKEMIDDFIVEYYGQFGTAPSTYILKQKLNWDHITYNKDLMDYYYVRLNELERDEGTYKYICT